jgi:hypothetical protein
MYPILTALVTQHRTSIKCDQVLLSKTVVVIYLMVETDILIQGLKKKAVTPQAPELVSKPRLKSVPPKYTSNISPLRQLDLCV